MIHKIGSAYAQIQNVYTPHYRIVKGVEEPRCIRDLKKMIKAVIILFFFKVDIFETKIAIAILAVLLSTLIGFLLNINHTWLSVNTRKMWRSALGANPKQSALDAITPATKVPWPRPSSSLLSPVQSVRSRTRSKCGCPRAKPVSNTATRIPSPGCEISPWVH